MRSQESRTIAHIRSDDTELPLLQVDQVGIVVRDLQRAVEVYSSIFRIGAWQGWTYSPKLMRSSSYRGPGGEILHAFSLAGSSPQMELIEPLAGPSLYHEWLAEHGEGLHHLGCRVRSLREAITSLTAAGYSVLQSGLGYGVDCDGGFAYLDTVAEVGVIFEVIEYRSGESTRSSSGRDRLVLELDTVVTPRGVFN